MTNPFDPGYYGSEELRGFGFKSVGENVSISRACNIVGLPNVEIGDHVRIDAFTAIIAVSGRVRIGNHIHIGGGCHLNGAGGIVMDDFSGLSQGVRIYSASDDYSGRHMTNPMVPTRYLGIERAEVRLGRHVIIGSGTVILPRGSVGEGSSVGALSLVTKPLAPWGIYSGTPAKRIRDRSRRLLELEDAMMGVAMAA